VSFAAFGSSTAPSTVAEAATVPLFGAVPLTRTVVEEPTPRLANDVRSATVILEITGRRILVDPMLDDAGARPPVGNTANPVRNPTVPLPFPAEDVVRGVEAVIVTHGHRDHLDGRAEELLPRDVPVFCQPEDEAALRELGLDARPTEGELEWKGLRVVRTPARHGFGEIAEALGPVSGFVLDDLYLAGDTVWYEGVEETIARHRPRGAVVGKPRPYDFASAQSSPTPMSTASGGSSG